MGKRAIRGFNGHREIEPQPKRGQRVWELVLCTAHRRGLDLSKPSEAQWGRGGQWEPCPRQCILSIFK
jgi:hypothetical protein